MTLTWSILGVGRAGRARARAIAADPRSEALLGYRGDPSAAGLRAVDTLEEALSGVDAVAVCAADAAHPALVEAALKAGRHVVCEYPLAPTVAGARRLRDLAGDLVLHVEHIELLGAAARWWRAHPPGSITSGRVVFTSARRDQSPTLGNLARLHRLMDIVGAPDAVVVHARTKHRLVATLHFGTAEVDLDFHFGPGLPRNTVLELQTDRRLIRQSGGLIAVDGTLRTLPDAPGLFATDQLHATAQILDGSPSYIGWDRILTGLALVEVLDAADIGVWTDFTPAT